MDPVLSLHREWCAAAADGGGDFTSRDGSGVSTWNGSWTAVPRPGVSKSKWKKKAGQLLDVTMEARPALSLPKTTAVLLKKQLVRDACALQFHKEVLNTYYLVYL